MRPHDEHDPEIPQSSETPTTPDEMSLAFIEEQADRTIRRLWHDGRWFFSVIDVIGILTDSPNPGNYWRVLKSRLREEGGHQTITNCNSLRMTAADGKQRLTDAGDAETMLRIVQSVPSPRAEPIKQWLARVGAKRVEELAHPIDAEQASAERDRLRRPERDASLLAWADYFEQMATLFRRQYAYEAQLRQVESQLVEHGERLEEQDEWLNEHAQRLEDHDEQLGGLQRDLADLKAGQSQLPDLLRRLGPQTLTPAHQARVKALAVRLHDLGGFAFPTIYGELNTHFHVGKYSDIADAGWEAVEAWFQVRLDAAQKRHNGQ